MQNTIKTCENNRILHIKILLSGCFTTMHFKVEIEFCLGLCQKKKLSRFKLILKILNLLRPPTNVWAKVLGLSRKNTFLCVKILLYSSMVDHAALNHQYVFCFVVGFENAREFRMICFQMFVYNKRFLSINRRRGRVSLLKPLLSLKVFFFKQY